MLTLTKEVIVILYRLSEEDIILVHFKVNVVMISEKGMDNCAFLSK